jgi:hypothetical protein
MVAADMVAADMDPDDMALGGDVYDGDTGSSLSAGMGGCSVFSVGKAWRLGGCCVRLYWSIVLYGEMS